MSFSIICCNVGRGYVQCRAAESSDWSRELQNARSPELPAGPATWESRDSGASAWPPGTVLYYWCLDSSVHAELHEPAVTASVTVVHRSTWPPSVVHMQGPQQCMSVSTVGECMMVSWQSLD